MMSYMPAQVKTEIFKLTETKSIQSIYRSKVYTKKTEGRKNNENHQRNHHPCFGVSVSIADRGNPPNKRLRWEKTKTMNFGTDIALFNNALNVTVDYYRRKGTDLIALRMLPLETGFLSTMVNWASMRNEGFEVALTTRNINRNGFTWFMNTSTL